MVIIKMKLNVVGIRTFHAVYIIRSYRYRGALPRISRNSEVMRKDTLREFASKTLERSLMKRMSKYSPMISAVNFVPEYSTLNPETSSDSPSEKSNGVRLVSANIIVNHTMVIGIMSLHLKVKCDFSFMAAKSRVCLMTLKKINVRIIGTS